MSPAFPGSQRPPTTPPGRSVRRDVPAAAGRVHTAASLGSGFLPGTLARCRFPPGPQLLAVPTCNCPGGLAFSRRRVQRPSHSAQPSQTSDFGISVPRPPGTSPGLMELAYLRCDPALPGPPEGRRLLNCE